MRGLSGALPQAVLIAGGAFGQKLSAERVLAAIELGLREGGREQVDLCPLEGSEAGRGQVLADLLAVLGFDTRMRAARVLVVAERRLERSTLERSAAFELATRARQAGVPCHAVTTANGLSEFDARMLDLQMIIEAGSARGLAEAGAALARLL